VAASVLTIMALSVERYLAIRHPVMLRRVLTPGRLRSVIVIIWALSVSVMLPLTVVRSVDHYPLLAVGQIITVCHEHWPSTVSFCSSSSRLYSEHVKKNLPFYNTHKTAKINFIISRPWI